MKKPLLFIERKFNDEKFYSNSFNDTRHFPSYSCGIRSRLLSLLPTHYFLLTAHLFLGYLFHDLRGSQINNEGKEIREKR